MLTLVDTSVWIAIGRSAGDKHMRARVGELMDRGEAAWCPMIELELWAGVQGRREREWLRGLATVLVNLQPTQQVWAEGFQLAERARARGVTVTATDLLIAATATCHNAEILTLDKHFKLLDIVGH